MVDKEFFRIIKDIVNHPKFTVTKNTSHHGGENTLFSHSVKTAFMTYNTAKRLGWAKDDIVSATRAAMLHDFIEFEWDTPESKEYKSQFKGLKRIAHMHCFIHGFQAVEYASKFFELDEKQKDAMGKHMFPLVPGFPKYKETWLLTYTDKMVAIRELAATVVYMLRRSKDNGEALSETLSAETV
ncbi:MAG: phosphohydrolase [Oscillospiraceae bacterium]|nr:phosphohydrolase [Oscillospiraceae bacterium]